jgi:hypothetical protein
MNPRRLIATIVGVAFAVVLILGPASGAQAVFYPRDYLASLHFYGPIDYYSVMVFPVRGSYGKLMNSSSDFNADG